MKTKKIVFYGVVGRRNNVTIPTEIINKYSLKTQSSFVILLEIKNTKFYSNVSYQNFSYSLYLPQFITRSLSLNPGDKIKIKIIDILKKKLSRSEISKLNFITNKQKDTEKQNINDEKIVDIKKLLSDKIKVLNKVAFFVIKNMPNNKLFVSYRYDSVNRKFKGLIIKRYIPISSFAQFLGFYIGDGTTSQNTGSVDFINTARDVIEWNLNFFKTYFVSKLKYCLVYGPIKPNKKNSEKIKKFWKKIGITNFRWSINKNYRNPSEFGAMRVYTISMPLKLIILKSLKDISEEATKNPVVAKFFLKGLAMSDMYPTVKDGILESVGVAFKEGDRNLIRLYSKIFETYGIKVRGNSKRIENTTALLTYRMEDFIKMLADDIFEFNRTRKNKLIKGLLNMDLFSRYFKRLKLFLNKSFTAEEYAKRSKLSDIPYDQLERLINFNFLNKTTTYPRLYFITTQGKELLNKLNTAN